MPRNTRSRRKVKKHGRTRPEPLLDSRATEGQMWELSRLVQEQELGSAEELSAFLQIQVDNAQLIHTPKLTAVDQAQELMYQAWRSSGKRRVQLTRQALKLSKDCADAYVLLAEDTAESLSEMRFFYEQGTAAGERALGEQFFASEAGHFWSLVETRPYMRALEGLARSLWYLGEKDQAIARYQRMLRLNPNDNQGIRYELASRLLELGMDEAAERLMKLYPEDESGPWLYSKALLRFHQRGPGRAATMALKKAILANPYVPAYLLGVKKLPKRWPEATSWGDDGEALDYLSHAFKAWGSSHETLVWVFETIAKLSENGPPPGRPSRDLPEPETTYLPQGEAGGTTVHLHNFLLRPKARTP